MLSKYIRLFKSMSVKQNMSYYNKPILLLTVIELIESKLLRENTIKPNEILVNHFYQNWLKHVKSEDNYNPNCWDPFYGLCEDGFWHIEYTGDEKESKVLFETRANRTEKNIKANVFCAFIDDELFELLNTPSSRDSLKSSIIQRYFNKEYQTELNLTDSVSPKIIPSYSIVNKRPNNSEENNLKSPILELYRKDFQNLHISMKNGGAPHKPILLLSIISLFEDNLLLCNEIYLDNKLKATFREMWDKYIGEDDFFQPTCWMPYLFLIHEDFWHFEYIISKEVFNSLFDDKKNRKESLVKENIRFAYLDEKLYKLLEEENSRSDLKDILIKKYISGRSQNKSIETVGKVPQDINLDRCADTYKKLSDICDPVYIEYNLLYFKQVHIKRKRDVIFGLFKSPYDLYSTVKVDFDKIHFFTQSQKSVLKELLKQLRYELSDYSEEVKDIKRAIAISSGDYYSEVQDNIQRRLEEATTVQSHNIQNCETPTTDTITLREVSSTKKRVSESTRKILAVQNKKDIIVEVLTTFDQPVTALKIAKSISRSKWGEAVKEIDVIRYLKSIPSVIKVDSNKFILKGKLLTEDRNHTHVINSSENNPIAGSIQLDMHEEIIIANKSSSYSLAIHSIGVSLINKRRSPNKPILLIALINLIDNGHYNTNQFYYSDSLDREFKDICEQMVYDRKSFKPNLFDALCEMNTEPFWTCVKMSIIDNRPIITEQDVKFRVRYFRFSDNVYKDLKDKEKREYYKSVLYKICEEQ